MKVFNKKCNYETFPVPLFLLLSPFPQVLQRLGKKMEVREVDFPKMMQLVDECSKEGSRDGEEEPNEEGEGGVFGLGLLTVKRGIMPGFGEFPLL